MRSKLLLCVPVFNGEKHIEETLLSLKNQQDKCDIVVLDNGSTDKSALIAKNIVGNSNVKSLGSSKSLGQSLNRSFSYAKSHHYKFVTICHADDVYHSDFTKKTLSKFESNKKVSLIHTSCELINGESFIILDPLKQISRRIINIILDICPGIKLKSLLFIVRNPIVAPSATFRVSDLEADYKFSENLTFHTDLMLWLKYISDQKKILWINSNLIKYRVHNLQKSMEFKDKDAFEEEFRQILYSQKELPRFLLKFLFWLKVKARDIV